MAKKFRLAALLKVRRIVEERRMAAFGEAAAALARAGAARAAAAAAFTGEQDQYNAAAAGSAPIAELRLRQNHLRAASAELERAGRAVEESRRAVEARRAELLAAQRDREVVETLHEKFRRRAEYEANKEADKQLAETAMNRFLRQRLEVEREVS